MESASKNSYRSDGRTGEVGGRLHKQEEISEARLLAAISGSKGRSDVIAKELQITTGRLDDLREKYRGASTSLPNELAFFLDLFLGLAHDNLEKLLRDGDREATFFILQRLGKHEGFTKRNEITGSGGRPAHEVLKPADECR